MESRSLILNRIPLLASRSPLLFLAIPKCARKCPICIGREGARVATSVQQLRFPPFRLDIANNLLWREEYQIPLRPKALAVLRVLVEKAGHVVAREELFHSVWGGTVVSDNVLKVCISEIREALGDASAKPRFIETLPKQGYRFIAPLSSAQPVVSSQHSIVSREEQSEVQPFQSALRTPHSLWSVVTQNCLS